MKWQKVYLREMDEQEKEFFKGYPIRNGSSADRLMFETGSYFKTKEEAKQYLKERKLVFKLHQWAKEKNDGWELDWEDDSQEKVFIYCFKNLKENLELTYKRTWNINKFTKLPYFKTYEIAQECIDLFGDEIKEVLC